MQSHGKDVEFVPLEEEQPLQNMNLFQSYAELIAGQLEGIAMPLFPCLLWNMLLSSMRTRFYSSRSHNRRDFGRRASPQPGCRQPVLSMLGFHPCFCGLRRFHGIGV